MEYFEKYLNKNDARLSYKYYHSLRVMDNMCLLAKLKNLSYQDIELAKCIGLLHDIGKLDNPRNDKDHGDYGVSIIKKKKILSNYNIALEDYEVVYKAIANHNKLTVQKELTNREKLFTKMLRDADKLDIISSLGNKERVPVLNQDDSEISESVKTSFYNNELIKRDACYNQNDHLLTVFSYVFDIEDKVTLNIIKKYQYYEKIFERTNNKKIFAPYINYINNYLKERTD